MNVSWLYAFLAAFYCSLWFSKRVYSAQAGVSPVIHLINAAYFILVAAVSILSLDSAFLFALGVPAAVGFCVSITRSNMAPSQAQTSLEISQFTIASNAAASFDRSLSLPIIVKQDVSSVTDVSTDCAKGHAVWLDKNGELVASCDGDLLVRLGLVPSYSMQSMFDGDYATPLDEEFELEVGRDAVDGSYWPEDASMRFQAEPCTNDMISEDLEWAQEASIDGPAQISDDSFRRDYGGLELDPSTDSFSLSVVLQELHSSPVSNSFFSTISFSNILAASSTRDLCSIEKQDSSVHMLDQDDDQEVETGRIFVDGKDWPADESTDLHGQISEEKSNDDSYFPTVAVSSSHGAVAGGSQGRRFHEFTRNFSVCSSDGELSFSLPSFPSFSSCGSVNIASMVPDGLSMLVNEALETSDLVTEDFEQPPEQLWPSCLASSESNTPLLTSDVDFPILAGSSLSCSGPGTIAVSHADSSRVLHTERETSGIHEQGFVPLIYDMEQILPSILSSDADILSFPSNADLSVLMSSSLLGSPSFTMTTAVVDNSMLLKVEADMSEVYEHDFSPLTPGEQSFNPTFVLSETPQQSLEVDSDHISHTATSLTIPPSFNMIVPPNLDDLRATLDVPNLSRPFSFSSEGQLHLLTEEELPDLSLTRSMSASSSWTSLVDISASAQMFIPLDLEEDQEFEVLPSNTLASSGNIGKAGANYGPNMTQSGQIVPDCSPLGTSSVWNSLFSWDPEVICF